MRKRERVITSTRKKNLQRQNGPLRPHCCDSILKEKRHAEKKVYPERKREGKHFLFSEGVADVQPVAPMLTMGPFSTLEKKKKEKSNDKDASSGRRG